MRTKTAIVTGASRGIGRAIAASLAEDGYNLILNCINNQNLLFQFSEELKQKYGVSCINVIGDIADADTSKAILLAASDMGFDVIVHNAAISKIGLITELSAKEWDLMIQTNLSSCYHLTKTLVPKMIAEKSGRILFLSSVWGERGASCEVAYSAAKGAVNAFTKALAKELAPSKISVNALACGIIDTDMNKELTKEEKQAIIDDIPVGYIASPKEVGEMARLILKAPPYLTGQIITFDGAWQ